MLGATVRREDDVAGLLIMFDDMDRIWHDGRRTVIDPAAMNPGTQVIRFRQRPDGPQ